MKRTGRFVATSLAAAGILYLATPFSHAAESKPGWQAEWEKVVAGAKKEGQVNIYIWGTTALLDSGAFQKAYPGIKVLGVSAVGPQLSYRILSERRAGKFLADVVIDGLPNTYPVLHRGGALDPIKPALLLPEVLDESKWWGGKHRYADPEAKYVLVNVGAPQSGGISYNTKLVDPKEFQFFWDFIKPKWKGKLLVWDIRGNPGRGSAAFYFFYHNPRLGPNFLTRLFAEMDPVLFRDARLATDWLSLGKYPLCFACDARTAKQQGLPVEQFGHMKEGAGMTPRQFTFALANKAPHPNAAKLFVNWYLSREGQTALQSAMAAAGENTPDSLREDIPKDMVTLDSRRIKGISYIPLDRAELLELQPIYKVVNEGLKQAGRE